VKVSLVSCGSRGDVQPMLALALGLERAGHQALLCAPPENEAWARSHGCPFQALGSGVRGNPSLRGGSLRGMIRFIHEELDAQVRDLPEKVKGSDLLLGTGLVFGAPSVAESQGIPYRYVALSPATSLGTTRDPLSMKVAGWLMKTVANAGLRGHLNRRRSELGLKPIDDVLSSWIGPRAIAATDAALTVVPAGARLKTTQTGYLHLEPGGELGDELEAFLESGPPPVYVGFGSMPIGDAGRMSRLLADVARTARRRLVVSGGWAGLPGAASQGDCLFVGDVPHPRLFPRVAAVVHHGGAGTVATAARAGVPQIVLPIAADQFQWRTEVVKLGLGPRAGIFRMISARSLTRAIGECLGNDRYRTKAAEIAAALKPTDGVKLTLRAIEEGPGRPAGA
jgi:UDP:flavonoid glycosyltransferase YjiC (YdhE family)